MTDRAAGFGPPGDVTVEDVWRPGFIPAARTNGCRPFGEGAREREVIRV